MVRRKQITKDHILNGAYKLVEKQGFSRFTSRSLAAFCGISTQPIYIEFKNMDNLKDELFQMIYAHLREDVFPIVHTNDAIVDLALNYMNFAKEEPQLYRALFLEKEGSQRVHQFSYNYFTELLQNSEKYNHLTSSEVESLLNGVWVVATGIASLCVSGTIQPTLEQKIQLIKDAITSISGMDHGIEINHA